MGETYNIIEVLREEEKRGKLKTVKGNSVNKSSNNYYNFENQFIDIIENISDGLLFLNYDSTISYINNSAEIFLCKKRDCLIGNRLFEVFPKIKETVFKDKYYLAFKKREIVSFESYFNSENNDNYYEFQIIPYLNGLFVIFSLIKNPDSKSISNNNFDSRYKDIFNLSPDGIITVNRRGIVTSCNPAFLRLTGFSKKDIVGKSAITLPTLTITSKVKMAGLVKKIMKGQELDSLIFDWKRKDGKLRKGNAKIGLLKEKGKVRGFQAILRDITDEYNIKNKLQEFEERYRSIFDKSLDLIYINDFKGNFIDANQACFNLLGYNKDELKKINFKSLLDKKQVLKAFKNMKEIKKYGFQKNLSEFKLRCKNGKCVYIETLSSLIYHEGKPVAIQGIARDITDRKKAEELILKEKMFSDSLLNSLPGIFYFFDENGHFLRWNKNFETVTEYDTNEISKITPIDLFQGDDKEKVADRIKEVFEKGQSFVEADFLTKSGKKIPYYFTGTRLILDKKVYLIGMGTDLTDLKKTQLELQKAHDNLEKKVEERTEEIKNILKNKDEFINQLGHDLKNPLTPLVNLLPILERKEKDVEKKQMLGVINRNVGYMKNLVTKTIELAKLNSPNTSFNFEEINLLSEVNKIIETNMFLFKNKKMKVINNVSSSIVISADKLRFEELLTNLFNNSVKYSQDSGFVKIDAKMDNSYVTVSICDNGVGMTDEQLNRVFDEFYKADNSRHDFDSSGLGMPICKRIVEIHGGKIWAESKGHGKGCAFYFTIPRKR